MLALQHWHRKKTPEIGAPMERLNITADSVISELKAVVAENPSYVYRPKVDVPRFGLSCYYVHDGEEGPEPGCLVGHVLNRLGVPLEEMRAFEGKDAHGLLRWLPVHIIGEDSHGAEYALEVAQNEQDSGRTWGEALATALGE